MVDTNWPLTRAAGRTAGQLALARLAPDGDIVAWLGWLGEVIDGYDRECTLTEGMKVAFKLGVRDAIIDRIGPQIALAKFLEEAAVPA